VYENRVATNRIRVEFALPALVALPLPISSSDTLEFVLASDGPQRRDSQQNHTSDHATHHNGFHLDSPLDRIATQRKMIVSFPQVH
jgi:hypothetical protein